MNPFLLTMLTCLCAVAMIMLFLWSISLVWQDASIIDRFWGAGFVLISWIAIGMNPAPTPRMWLLIGMVTIWGVRLSGYLSFRNYRHGEDRRYQSMRRYHGQHFWWVSFFTVFLLQGLLLWLISLPLQIAAVRQLHTPFAWLDLVGGFLWLAGMLFESIADWQLSRFKSNPLNADRVMDDGLWHYSRHPNYFGDFCVWWGIFIVAAAGGAAATFASPLLMSFLLLRVSGVTLLESTITARRPDYAAYQQRTSPFFPWFPRAQ